MVVVGTAKGYGSLSYNQGGGERKQNCKKFVSGLQGGVLSGSDWPEPAWFSSLLAVEAPLAQTLAPGRNTPAP